MDDDVIISVTRLQYVWKREGFSLSLRQSREAKGDHEFLANLKLLLGIDLRRYAMGGYELVSDLPERIYRFRRGAVITRMFSQDDSDVEFADQLLQALLDEERLQNPADAAGDTGTEPKTGMPAEIDHPCWLDLYRYWSRLGLDKPSETEGKSVKDVPFREVCIFLQNFGSNSPVHEERLVGLLTFIGKRFPGETAIQVFQALNEISVKDPTLFDLLLDDRLLKVIGDQYGARGVAGVLESVAVASQRCEEPLLGEFLGRVIQQLSQPGDLVKVLKRLRRLADHEGIAPETLLLVTEQRRFDRFTQLLNIGTGSQDSVLSIDAQRVLIAIMSKYKLKQPDQAKRLAGRLANIGLDPALRERLLEDLASDPRFATEFIRKRFDEAAVLSDYEQSDGFDQRFYYLILLACQNFDGFVLGSVTRGLSILLRLKRESMIDDSHYRLIFSDLTDDLPRSLIRLHEQPDDLDLRLRQLYLPVMVAGELLHSKDATPYLSDFYYELRRRDSEARPGQSSPRPE